MLEHTNEASSLDAVMSSSTRGMDITESFRPEDLSKTDFFDFVTAPEIGMGVDRPTGGNGTNDSSGNQNDQPLQGFDQVSTVNFKTLF